MAHSSILSFALIDMNLNVCTQNDDQFFLLFIFRFSSSLLRLHSNRSLNLFYTIFVLDEKRIKRLVFRRGKAKDCSDLVDLGRMTMSQLSQITRFKCLTNHKWRLWILEPVLFVITFRCLPINFYLASKPKQKSEAQTVHFAIITKWFGENSTNYCMACVECVCARCVIQ